MKMLLKYSTAQKKIRGNSNGKLNRNSSGAMRVSAVNNLQRHRKVLNRNRVLAKRELVRPLDPCDNSNDSGLGFDHHSSAESQSFSTLTPFNFQQSTHKNCWLEEPPDLKRRRPDVKVESDNAIADFSFSQNPSMCAPSVSRSSGGGGGGGMSRPTRRIYGKRLQNITTNSPISVSPRDPKTYLQIICQPEQQHRARYQTEGSRGAVKDRTGNGFPVVKLVGFSGPAMLEVFIGTDQGKIAPHMFYQACRVAGKNSTPCIENKMDGTVVIEIDFDPTKDMTVTCDCVGILKERNVDVEQRFPEESCARNKKKSTRCRMVFRTTLVNQITGETEILQVASQPIVCTQPPGVPEICKKSLSSCPVSGGAELFILGKNFLKDTQIIFYRMVSDICVWEKSVAPDKEFLQQSHLVCKIPPYEHLDIKEPVGVLIRVVSSNRSSEPQSFLYTPESSHLWPPTLSNIIKNEHNSPLLMPVPSLTHHIHAPSNKIDPFFSSSQKLDAIVNSAADSHIQNSPVIPTTPLQLLSVPTSNDAKMSLLPGLLTKPDQFSQNSSLMADTSVVSSATSQQQIVEEIVNKGVSEVNSLLNESCTASSSDQQIIQQMINKSVADTNTLLSTACPGASPQEIIQDIIISKSVSAATDSVLRENCPTGSSEQLLQKIMDKTEENLKMNFSHPNPLISTSCTTDPRVSVNPQQQQNLLDHIIQKTEHELKLQLHEATNVLLSETCRPRTPEQLMPSMSLDYSRASSLMSDSCSEGSCSPPQHMIIKPEPIRRDTQFSDSSNMMTNPCVSKSNASQHLIRNLIKTEETLCQYSTASLMDDGSSQSRLLQTTSTNPNISTDETSQCMVLDKNESPLSYLETNSPMTVFSGDLKLSLGGEQSSVNPATLPPGLIFHQTNSLPVSTSTSVNKLCTNDLLNFNSITPPVSDMAKSQLDMKLQFTKIQRDAEDILMLPVPSKHENQFSKSPTTCQASSKALLTDTPNLDTSPSLIQMIASSKSNDNISQETSGEQMLNLLSSSTEEIKMTLHHNSTNAVSRQMIVNMITSTPVHSLDKSNSDLKLEFSQQAPPSNVSIPSKHLQSEPMDVQFSQSSTNLNTQSQVETPNENGFPSASTHQMLQIMVHKSEEPNTVKDISTEIAQMSANDLLSYINPSCFDNV